MLIKSKTTLVGIILLGLTLPQIALADAGIPIIFLTYPAVLGAFIPVVIIEAIVMSKMLKIKFGRSLVPSLTGNFVSMLLGFPLAWICLLIIQLIVVGGGCPHNLLANFVAIAWLCEGSHADVFVFFSIGICLVVAFFVSVLIEYFISKKILKTIGSQFVKKSVWVANIISYIFLVIAGFLGWYIHSI